MAVTVTSSVNLIFGSRILEPDTGMILDDTVSRIIHMQFMLLHSYLKMDDFSTPGIADAWGIYASPCPLTSPHLITS